MISAQVWAEKACTVGWGAISYYHARLFHVICKVSASDIIPLFFARFGNLEINLENVYSDVGFQ
jgi:hypothetical protein